MNYNDWVMAVKNTFATHEVNLNVSIPGFLQKPVQATVGRLECWNSGSKSRKGPHSVA